ncbi:transmembrane secretion effector [Leptospira inadai serovar Lyme str. 10]|uniref:Transmembrane secretion effector n=2 Tax=Leptospira inadai serovar Lyme TaxID=293084 RepID=V6HBE2_9LEPT|nr:MFS transporter [Leptospira inadai]EQA36941.1 transmembrane secretion effector [Leptospira inadai serovar Lyme str. 10]PNV75529.1 MFS transporter [Leptospira inadai serovar Lyme]
MKKKFFSRTPFESLLIPEFRNFILAKFLITTSFILQSTIVFWQIYKITGDALSLGLIGLTEAIPSIFIAFFSGLVVDSVPRKKVIVSSLALLTLCSILLYSFTTSYFSWIILSYGSVPIYSVIFLSGIARGFLSPSVAAFQTQLVPKEVFPNAATWGGIAWQASSVLGPFLGGLLIGFSGIELAYFTDMSLMILAFGLLLFIPSKPLPESGPKESILVSLASGWKFVFGHQVILGAISLDLFAVLFGGAVALLPAFAEKILSLGPEGYGILRMSPAAGAVLCALFIAAKPPKKDSGKLLLACVFGFGLSMILFAFSRNFYLSAFALIASGAFDMVSVVIRQTIVQLYTPEHMRGRVSAVNSIFIGSSNEIGAFESGVMAKWMGLAPSVVFGGLMTLVTVGFVATVAPRLRKLDLKDVTG